MVTAIVHATPLQPPKLPKPIVDDVEASRAKRLERQQARFRDRGG